MIEFFMPMAKGANYYSPTEASHCQKWQADIL